MTKGEQVRLTAWRLRVLQEAAAGSRAMAGESVELRPSLCAGVCCRLPLLVAPKGQEKGNVSGTLPPQYDADPVLAKDRPRQR
jgi:hypothetical protein